MNKGLYLFVVLAIFMTVISCESSTEKNAETEAFNLSQFDYIAHLYFLKTWKECEQLLPNPKTLVVDNEDGFGYNFGLDNIKQNATFLFYGADFFSEAIVEIDFSENTEQLESSYLYITKLIENQRGKAALHENTANQETNSWFEETTDGELFVLTLTKYDHLIAFNLRSEEIEYGGGDEGGEWVQRGEDGEWIFVPD